MIAEGTMLSLSEAEALSHGAEEVIRPGIVILGSEQHRARLEEIKVAQRRALATMPLRLRLGWVAQPMASRVRHRVSEEIESTARRDLGTVSGIHVLTVGVHFTPEVLEPSRVILGVDIGPSYGYEAVLVPPARFPAETVQVPQVDVGILVETSLHRILVATDGYSFNLEVVIDADLPDGIAASAERLPLSARS
jgi:hypothetical protein